MFLYQPPKHTKHQTRWVILLLILTSSCLSANPFPLYLQIPKIGNINTNAVRIQHCTWTSINNIMIVISATTSGASIITATSLPSQSTVVLDTPSGNRVVSYSVYERSASEIFIYAGLTGDKFFLAKLSYSGGNLSKITKNVFDQRRTIFAKIDTGYSVTWGDFNGEHYYISTSDGKDRIYFYKHKSEDESGPDSTDTTWSEELLDLRSPSNWGGDSDKTGYPIKILSIGNKSLISLIYFPFSSENRLCVYINFNPNAGAISAVRCANEVFSSSYMRIKRVKGLDTVMVSDAAGNKIIYWDYLTGAELTRTVRFDQTSYGSGQTVSPQNVDVEPVDGSKDLVLMGVNKELRYYRTNKGENESTMIPTNDYPHQIQAVCSNQDESMVGVVVKKDGVNLVEAYVLTQNNDCSPACGESCTGNGADDCISCPSGKLLLEDKSCTTTGTCPPGTFLDDPINEFCSSCPIISPIRHNNACISSCPLVGFYEKTESFGKLCGSCDGSCDKCSGNTTTDCLGCTPANFFLVGSLPPKGECLPNCPAEFYKKSDPLGNTCEECNSPCINCSGPLNTECLSCGPAKFLYKLSGNSGSCSSSCPNGFYKKTDPLGNTCEPCDLSCSTCFGPLTTECLSCGPTLFLNKLSGNIGSCSASCPDGLYKKTDPLGNTCETCSSECQACSGPLNTECLSCDSPLFLKKLSGNSGKCNSSCPSIGFYEKLNPLGNTCESCDPSCTSCSGLLTTECLSCGPTLFLFKLSGNSGNCSSSCPTGFYKRQNPSGNTCESCDSSCPTCSGPLNTECLSCDSPFFLNKLSGNSGSCSSSCPLHKTENPVLRECLDCTSPCENCLNGDPTKCSSCLQGQSSTLKLLEGSVCVSGCSPHKYVDNFECHSCHGDCDQCSASGPANCLSCLSPSKFFENGSCVDSCSTGYHSIDTETCEAYDCFESCQACSGPDSDQCTSCKNLYEPKGSECILKGQKIDFIIQEIYSPETPNEAVFRINTNLNIKENDEETTVVFDVFKDSEKQKIWEITDSEGNDYESYTKTKDTFLETHVKLPRSKTTNKVDLQFKLVKEQINQVPPMILTSKEITLSVEQKNTITEAEIEDSVEKGKTLSTVNQASQGIGVSLASLASLIGADPSGLLLRFSMALDLYNKLKYVNVYRGILYEEYIKPQSSETEKAAILHIEENGSKGKFSYYQLRLKLSYPTILKGVVYMISWILKIWALVMFNNILRTKEIKPWKIHFLRYQNKIHFLVFNIAFSDILFYGGRIVLHMRIKGWEYQMMRIGICILMFLISIDFILIFQEALKIAKISNNQTTSDKSSTIGFKYSNSIIPKGGFRNRDSPIMMGSVSLTKTPGANSWKKARKYSTRDSRFSNLLKNSATASKKKYSKFQQKTRESNSTITIKKSQTGNHLISPTPPKKATPSISPSNNKENNKIKIIDFEKTLITARRNIAITNYLTNELKRDSLILQIASCVLTNFTFLVRIGIYQVLLMSLPNSPRLQITLISGIETIYLAGLLMVFWKYKHLYSTILFGSKIIQSLFMLLAFVIVGYLAFLHGNKKEEVNKGVQKTEMFIRETNMYTEMVLLAVTFFVKWCYSRKKKNGKKKQYIFYKEITAKTVGEANIEKVIVKKKIEYRKGIRFNLKKKSYLKKQMLNRKKLFLRGKTRKDNQEGKQ